MRKSLMELKWVAAPAAAVLVVGLTFGGAAAIKALGGGGAQPEDVLPANAIAFSKLDLNPAAGQKVAAYRLASKFPDLKKKVTSEDSSIKEAIFGSIFTGPTKDSGLGLDYKKDVAPWLGDRVGVGVFPDMNGDKKPEVGLAIAVTDPKAAKVALDKANVNAAKAQKTSKKPVMAGYTFVDGYVIVSDTTATATSLAEAGKKGTLADSTYAEDVKELGSDQIGVAWADIAAVIKAIPKDQLGKVDAGMMPGGLGMLGESLKGANDPKNASGRVVVGLHADASYLELSAKGLDIKGVGSLAKGGAGTAMIASFPGEVFGAATVTGLGKAAGTIFASFTTKDVMGIKSTLAEMGITSAQQIETLLGAETGVAVAGSQNDPQFAIRTRNSDPDAALALARRVLATNGAPSVTVTKVTGPDGLLITGPKGSELTPAPFTKPGDTLAGTEAFQQVIPDVGKADFALYVDLAKVIPLLPGGVHVSSTAFQPLKAMGMTASGGAEPTFRLRLSVK